MQRCWRNALGFVTKSVFWLGLVYSSMPFDERIAPTMPRSIGPAALSGPLAACTDGMLKDCRNAVKRLRLAAEIVTASGDLLHKSLTKDRFDGAAGCQGPDEPARRRSCSAGRDPLALVFEALAPICAWLRGREVLVSAFDTIRDDFASLDEWEDRYRYVIELGHDLEPLSEEAHNDANKVRGCVSQVWLEREGKTPGRRRSCIFAATAIRISCAA